MTQIVSFPTRFRNGQNPSLLDLVLLHDELLVQSLDSFPGIGKSDHVILSLVLNIPITLKVNKNAKFNFQKADYNLMNSIINCINWEAEFQNLSCDEALEIFHCFLLTICHNLLPQSKPPVFSSSHAPWMSRDIKKLVNKKKRAWDKYKLHPTVNNLEAYKQIRNSLTSNIRQKKIDYERDLVIGCKKTSKPLFSYINSKKKTQPLTCLKTNEGMISDDTRIAEELSNFFQSVFTRPTGNAGHYQVPSDDPHFSPFFTENDVFKCLSELKTDSSPGPDGIHPLLLKNCATSISKPLFLLFCSSLRTGIFPSQWKDANVVPLHKGGCQSSPDNYRPVCLLSSIGKVFEKIVSRFLTNFLSDTNFIHQSQHGFVKGKSCLTNLLCGINHWSLALDKRQSCDVIYLDFKKAFDTVDHCVLLNKLEKLKLPSFLFRWLGSYLNNRRFRVSLRGSFSSWSCAPSGVPQGSVLGPTLFNIFINDLPSYLRYSFCLLFADDLKIYRTINSASDYLLLQSDLNAVAAWAKENRMSFNISKSAVLHLGYNNHTFVYFLNDQQISPKESIKDLGIIVDRKLNFHQQSAHAAKKAISTASWIFKSFSFLTRHLFSILYKVFVRPNLEYCIQAWRPHLKKSIDVLEKTQRKITKWCPGISHYSYENRLQLLDLPTLNNRYDRGDLIETFKILKQHYNISPNSFFTMSRDDRTRGHSLKLFQDKYHTDTRKYFFTNRVVHQWNRLPELLISSSSINQWKMRYSDYLLERL